MSSKNLQVGTHHSPTIVHHNPLAKNLAVKSSNEPPELFLLIIQIVDLQRRHFERHIVRLTHPFSHETSILDFIYKMPGTKINMNQLFEIHFLRFNRNTL